MGFVARKLAVWAITFFAALSFMGTVAQPALASVNFFGEPCRNGSGSTLCGNNSGDNITGTNGVILKAASLLSIIAGIAAVIMIMLAGFMFITAGGDSSKVSNARKTLAYAVVGLIVIVLARTIVIFVVSRV